MWLTLRERQEILCWFFFLQNSYISGLGKNGKPFWPQHTSEGSKVHKEMKGGKLSTLEKGQKSVLCQIVMDKKNPANMEWGNHRDLTAHATGNRETWVLGLLGTSGNTR